MTKMQEYKAKIECEIAELEGKLHTLKEKAKIQASYAEDKYDEAIDDIQKHIEITKSKLAQAGNAAEGEWEKVKAESEEAWGAVKNMFNKAIDKFKN